MAWPWRGRIGALVNHNDPTPETELWAMVPDGVTVHTARFEGPRQKGQDYGPDAAAAFADSADLARGLEFLGRMRLDAILLCFSTASVLGPPGFDEQLATELTRRAGGIPVVTAASAMQAAISAMGIHRPLIVVPPWFSDALLEGADAYFRRSGLDVAGLYRVEMGAAWSALETYEIYDRGGHWEVRVEDVYRGVRAACPAEADGIVQIGNGLYAIDAIAPLEEDLGIPVLTANQAGLWWCLRVAGIGVHVEGCGRLFTSPTTRRQAGG